MTIPNFQLGYPPDGSSLGNTKLQMRDNIDGTILTLSVDHRNANQTTPGYHTIIHQVLQGSDPAAITGINQIYSKVAAIPSGGDTQLFSITGNGGISQLTGNHTAPNGFTWIGGALIQWGFVPGNHTANNYLAGGDTGSISFDNNPNNYMFHNNAFNIFPSLTYLNAPSSTGGTATVTFKSLTTGGVNWFYSSNSTNTYNGFYWVAIGN